MTDQWIVTQEPEFESVDFKNNEIKSRDSERALLGAMMKDGTLYEQAHEIVKPVHFGNTAYGYAWLAMEHLHEQGMGIDTITVGDELERMDKMVDFSNGQWSGRALLGWLRDEGEIENFLAYAENVQDYSIKRNLDPFFAKCVAWARNGRRAKNILKDIETEFSKITLYSASDEYTVPIGTAVSEAYDWTSDAAAGKVVGVPTGFIDLDRMLGSLIKGNVYLIAARPKQGKTAFLISTMLNAARKYKKRVGIFSLEMSRMQVGQRLISQVSGIDLHNIIMGQLREDEWSRFTHAVEEIDALSIVINDLSSININQIRQTARKIKAAGGLDLLIVDYIQLADSGEKKHERRELDVSAVSRGLKYLARELEVPILAAAQLSRAVEMRSEKRPILSDLRESGSLEQDAYAVIFLHNDPEKIGTTELIVAAHRNGATGSCELMFKSSMAKFENLFVMSKQAHQA